MISRTFFAAVWLAVSLCAAPPLTTIQDVLYKADGTRFNGSPHHQLDQFRGDRPLGDRAADQQPSPS